MSLIQRMPQTNFLSSLYKISSNDRTILVIGLGNVGKKYELTRHNFGFICVDMLADAHRAKWKNDVKFSSQIATVSIDGKKVILVKPQTFMNLSGEAVQKIKAFYKLENKDIVVIHDELDIDFGLIRTRSGGGSAGHNGLKSIIQHIGEDFGRIRAGIGPKSPEQIDSADFVLQRFSKEQHEQLDKATLATTEIIKDFVNSEGSLPQDTRNFLI